MSLRVIAFLFMTFAGAGPVAVSAAAQVVDACPVSAVVRETAPLDRDADPVGPALWYINADRTIWAGPVPDGGWPAGGRVSSGSATVNGQKTYWVRPAGTPLAISGRRLDASAPPVEAELPCCYPSGFQIVALHFPSEGCWEVSATAGAHELRFVTRVVPPAAMPRIADRISRR